MRMGALNRVTIACFRAQIYGKKYLQIEIIHLTQPRVFRHRPAFRLGRALKKPIFD